MKFLKPSYKGITPKTLTSFIAFVYLLLMFVVYPFYMKEGYVNIGEHKFKFFLYSSLGAVLLLLLTGFVELIKTLNQACFTDIVVIFFALSGILSYFFSDYRDTAFLGSDGWFLGLVFILTVCMIYLLVSRLWEFDIFIIYLGIFSAAIVYILGILDRFSLYIIPLSIRDPSFISTLGNINWFMGYYSVFTPLGLFMFLFEMNNKDSNLIKRYLLGLFAFIAFLAGFAQGSESVFLVFIAILNIGIFLIWKKYIDIRSMAMVIIMWGLSAQCIRLIRMTAPELYNYDSAGMCDYLTSNNITAVVSILGILLYLVLCRYESNNSDGHRKILLVVPALEILGLVFIIIIGILKTKTNIISGFNNSLFYFDLRFGSGRGAAYKVTFEAIKTFGIKEYLIGTGPDCFSKYLYGNPDIKNMLLNIWPSDTLTNAHNEPLTMFVNQGIIGVTVYYSVFICFLVKTVKRCTNPVVMCINAVIFTYLVHNLISFTQVLSTPYIFILMGIARAYEMREFFDKT